jgi:hypothetical protein
MTSHPMACIVLPDGNIESTVSRNISNLLLLEYLSRVETR